MKALIRFEFCKLFQRKLVWLGLLVLAATLFLDSGSTSVLTKSDLYCPAADQCESALNGQKAVEENRKVAERYKGEWSDETTRRVIADYELQPQIEKLFQAEGAVYLVNGRYDYRYNIATQVVMERLVDPQEKRVRSIAELSGGADTLHWDIADFYTEMIQDSSSLIVLLSFFFMIVFAPMFAEEYSTRADRLILSSRYGKREAIVAKLLTALLSVIVLYAVSLLILFGVNALRFGIQGGDTASILVSYAGSAAYTMQESMWLQLGVNLLSLLMMSALTICFSAYCSSFLTILIQFGLYFIPLIVFQGLEAWQQILLAFLPINQSLVYNVMDVQQIYLPSLFGLAALVYAGITVISTLGSYVGFRYHQPN